MLITRGLDEELAVAERVAAERAVVVGAFDGLHIGHQYLIRRTCAEAAARGLESTVLTFEPVPHEFFAEGGSAGTRLTVGDERVDLFRRLCVNRLVIADFDAALREMSAEAFARDVLVGLLNTKVLIASENHTFGCGAEAGIDAIRTLGERYGFSLVVLPLLALDGMRVSSTQIRQYLHEAHAEEAASLLGRLYSLRGRVVKGAGVGRSLGFPTANIEVPSNKLTPAPAVYAGLADGPALREQLGAGAVPCPTAVNIGPQPTFGRMRSTIEAHIITDTWLELDGTEIELHFVRRLRFGQKFPDVATLKAQISADVGATKSACGDQGEGCFSGWDGMGI